MHSKVLPVSWVDTCLVVTVLFFSSENSTHWQWLKRQIINVFFKDNAFDYQLKYKSFQTIQTKVSGFINYGVKWVTIMWQEAMMRSLLVVVEQWRHSFLRATSLIAHIQTFSLLCSSSPLCQMLLHTVNRTPTTVVCFILFLFFSLPQYWN